MAGKTKKIETKEQYLKMPYHILNIEGISLSEKLLLSHIYGFSTKGCWQSNETIGRIFMVKERSISRWVKNLKKNGLVFWVHPKGRYRTLWAKSHPDVKAKQQLFYMGEKISKEAVIKGHAAQILHGQNCQGTKDRTVAPTATNECVQVRQNCLHINNTTKKDIIRKTIEPPSPLPAGGQAPAALEQRTRAQKEAVNNFLNTFGRSKRMQRTLLSEQETRDRVQQQRKALLASK